MKRRIRLMESCNFLHFSEKKIRILKLAVLLLFFMAGQTMAGESFSQSSLLSPDIGNFLPELLKNNEVKAKQPLTVTGTVKDADGFPILGVTVMVKGTTNGTITSATGSYELSNVPSDGVLVFSFVGMKTMEVPVEGRTTVDAVMEVDALGLDEVVVVGYGTKKKINLTGAVSTASKEQLDDRPVANVQQALQGLVSNLVIQPSVAGGEPGSDMAMNIRGLTSFEGGSSPYVLVDGIPMGINDIDPNDIESISVLKDAASTSIYGARAAYGVILITTKRGTSEANVSYSTNYGVSTPTIWPELAGGMSWAHALNDASINGGGSPFYPEEALERLRQNLENPGSAPAMLPLPDGLDWDLMNTGTKGVANDDITNLLVRDWAPKVKHNLNVSGGTDKFNYYVSGGYYNEEGLLTFGDESYKRYTVDAKISGKVTSWMELSFLSKFKQGKENFPWNQFYGRSWYMNWLGKLKPGTPAKYPGTDIWTKQTRVEEWKNLREIVTNNQIVLSPRIALEPITGWVTNIELNYIGNQIENTRYAKQYPWVRPGGEIAYEPQSRAETQYLNDMRNNVYLSPNIYSSFTKDFGVHDFQILAGFQQELYEYSNLFTKGVYLLSDAVPSISTSVGEQTTRDEKGHWATRSYFGRLNYSFADKYLLEVNIRTDGSSRFEEDERWGLFPSVSAGWIITEENFFPETDFINLLKIRGSYGTLGNQDVDNYLYIPTMNVRQTNYWLFGDERAWTVIPPNLESVNLTWEKVATIDLGLDAQLLNNRLGFSFGVYETRTTDLVGPGEPLPAILGTDIPKKNAGEIKTRGWELEVSWRQRAGQDFSYDVRAVVSDYKRTVVSYTNPTKLLDNDFYYRSANDRYYDGQVIGEIWGLRYNGHYQSPEDVESYGIDQSYVYSGNWYPGDFKYKDLNGDGKVDIGDNTVDNPGDLDIIGNNTPRYIFGLNLGAQWKSFDVSVFLQGTGKRDWSFGSSSVFRGPGAGPMHNNVLEDHLDYWRDETSALGPNPDAYFPKPYAQFFGQNAKNYRFHTDHLLQDASYIRLKNLQIGYNLPRNIAEKILMSSARIYISGENILTFTDLMFFDPEALEGRWYGNGDAYPLSKTWSVGLNLNF